METILNNTYPIYAKDQVLSHLQLNASFNYLEEQIRITRKGLIAYGLIDGLELSVGDSSITISEGLAVTSLGFQVQWESTTFTHYEEYEISKDFLEPNIVENESIKQLLQNAIIYKPIKDTILLSSDNTKTPFNKLVLIEKVLLLLLDYNFKTDDKCAIDNCDEKASNILINIRPLLISKDQALALENVNLKNNYIDIQGLAPFLPRFNVPKTILFSKSDIENEYLKIFQKTGFPEQLIAQLKDCAVKLKPHFNHLSNFQLLENPTIDNKLIKSNNIQYAYAWLNDIRNTLQEIYEFEKIWAFPASSGIFPFHIMLGALDQIIQENQFRTYFYPSAVLMRENNPKFLSFEKLVKRLIHFIGNFEISGKEVKVTPSYYSKRQFKNKAIPFYYKNSNVLANLWPSDNSPFGYFANEYTANPQVINPLAFDLEPANFFRIEGHIGTKYTDTLNRLLTIQEANRLPFKIIAINALDISNREITFQNDFINFRDLEVDYDIARKRVNNIGLDINDWLTNNKAKIISEAILTDESITAISNLILSINKLFTDDLGSFLDQFSEFNEAYAQLHSIYKFHRLCIESNSFLREELLDQLDKLNILFLENPFTVLYEEAKDRYLKGIKKTLLSEFYKNHEGIEPINGVTKGGTFVLVYLDSSILTPKKKLVINKDFIIASAQVKTYKDTLKIEPAKQKMFDEEFKTKLLFSSKTMQNMKVAEISLAKKDEISEMEAIVDSKLKNAIETQVPAYLKGSFLEIYDKISEKFQNKPNLISNDEGLVIADFCLPYICCGGESGINIMLPPPAQAIIPIPLISIDKNQFCQNNPEKIEILVSPKGIKGKFNSAAIISENGKSHLETGKLKIGSNIIIFTSDDKKDSNALDIKLLAARVEDLKIKLSQNPANPNEQIFSLTNPIADETYTIDFGDGSQVIVSDKTEFNHVYPSKEIDEKYALIITSKIAETCPHISKSSVEIKAIVKPVFKIAETKYCSKDDNTYCFDVDQNFKVEKLNNPDGLEFSAKPLCFIPAKQNIDNSKIYNLDYSGIKIQIQIQKTSGEFVYNEDKMALIATDQKAEKYNWEWEILKAGVDIPKAEIEFLEKHKSNISKSIFNLDLSLIKDLGISRMVFLLQASSKCNSEEIKHTLGIDGQFIKILE